MKEAEMFSIWLIRLEKGLRTGNEKETAEAVDRLRQFGIHVYLEGKIKNPRETRKSKSMGIASPYFWLSVLQSSRESDDEALADRCVEELARLGTTILFTSKLKRSTGGEKPKKRAAAQ